MVNDPFTALQTPAPDFSTQQASALLREHYGIDASLEPLVSERDQNFLAAATEGDKYVLKIANTSESAAITDFQIHGLMYVARTGTDFEVPRVIATNEGELMFEVESDSGGAHGIRLLSWLDGVPLRHAQGVGSMARQTGACLAKLGIALRGFEHPASDYPLLWDIRNAASLEQLLPQVNDEQLRKLCEQRLECFRDKVAPRLENLRSQVIHNDMNPSNVLVDSTAAYFCAAEEDPFVEVVKFLGSYAEILPLTEDEIVLLPDLILTRHLTTVMISHWRASLYPDNAEYILRSEGRAREMLYRVSGLSIDATVDRFFDICEQGARKEAAT